MTTKISFKKQTVFHLRHMGEWADISVSQGRYEKEQSMYDSGWVTVSILSTFGSHGHHWCSIGADSWWEFLVSLDKDYFLKKVMDQRNLKDFSAKETLVSMRRHVLEYRRDMSIEKDEARLAWATITDIENDLEWEPDTPNLFRTYMIDDPYWSQEFYEYFQYEYSVNANGLWERIWQPFTMLLRNDEELQNAT